MTDFKVRVFATAITVLCAVYGLDAQTEAGKKLDFSVGVFGNGPAIVYAKDDDGLPEKILATGTIVDASVAGTYCGFTGATGGTLKINLSERVEGYNHEFLYVVVLCLAGKENEDLIGKPIKIKVNKLIKYPFKSAARLANHLDSGSIPYYYSTIDGVGGLLKKGDSLSK